MIQPEFFDIFGMFVFLFLIIIGIYMLKSRKKLPKWAAIIFLLIGILGFIIDSYLVLRTYILN